MTESPLVKVADSEFIGFIKPIKSEHDALNIYKTLKREHPKSAHIPYSWTVINNNNVDAACCSGYEEDGEPQGSTGPALLNELQNFYCPNKANSNIQGYDGYVLIIVRYFGHRLLGVTCGRLTQCYQSIAKLTLHRHFNSGKPLHLDFTTQQQPLLDAKYGLGYGDCELIPNVIENIKLNYKFEDSILPGDESDPSSRTRHGWVHSIINELEFSGFRGHKQEQLPRLQNLQADISSGIIPVYRYPGNYRGDEWETYQWSSLSYQVKNAVEKNLLPLVEQQMNHCVTNYYRDGKDFIDHHSDKTLDLDKNGVIISISLGDERILELKRKTAPYDTTKIILPHGSMLVLGQFTNQHFTHSILRSDSTQPRVSLTFRRVLTFMDCKTGRLFGEGVSTKSLFEIRKSTWFDDCLFFILGTSSAIASSLLLRASSFQKRYNKYNTVHTIASAFGTIVLSYLSFKKIRLLQCKRKEENEARSFFSKTSVNGTKY